MASPNNKSLCVKVHEDCRVAPPSAIHLSLPLTFFDLFWLRFHPVERIFFYSLPLPHSNPSFFFDTVLPKLKTSLSLTLQHFLPLAGNVVWPSNSQKPFIQYNPGDAVSVIIAESDADFNHLLDYNPREAVGDRYLVPHLDSSDSLASVISLQITLFPNSGFCIGISSHHAVVDGKSSIMFIKAWAHLCRQTGEETPSLLPELEPFLDREVIKDPTGLDVMFTNSWRHFSSRFDPTGNCNERSLKILSNVSDLKLDNSVRATFDLSRADLDNIKKLVLSKWDMVVADGAESNQSNPSKPPTLSTFVLTCAYVSVCIAKAFEGAEKERQKFASGFTADCRPRLEPPVPVNYFGNCVSGHLVETEPCDFTKEDGVVIIARKIHSKIKLLDKGVLDGGQTPFSMIASMESQGLKAVGVAGSTRFGVYGTDFGWGKPAKVEIISVDRGLTIGLTESKDERGGVEVGLVLNKQVMGLFNAIFQSGLCFD